MDRRTVLKFLSLNAATFPFTLHASKDPEASAIKHVILIELKGGNDGLNTVIPYGVEPSLESLDANGDLIFTTDFRSLYHTISKEWTSTSSTLLSRFPIIPLLKTS